VHDAAATAARGPRDVAVVRRLVRILVPRLGHGLRGDARQGIPDVGVLVTVVARRFTTTRLFIIRRRLIGAAGVAGLTATTRRGTTATATTTRRTRLLRLGPRHRL